MLEARNILSSASVADTAITFGSAAGYCGGDFGPKLPDAAISTAPLALAAASWRARPGSAGPAKLMLMMRACCSEAYSTLLRIAMVVASATGPAGHRRRGWRGFSQPARPPSAGHGRRSRRQWRCHAMRLLGLAERVERADDRARQFGMTEVDAGIDHRDQHPVAVGERVRLADAELGERVLRRVAAGRDRRARSPPRA